MSETHSQTGRNAAGERLEALLRSRIAVIDGAMGTMIQQYGLDEAGYRGERFADYPQDLRGNNDLLSLTRPEVIREIHAQYLDAGADILETNTFNSTSISQADYGLESIVAELNLAGARLAQDDLDRIGVGDRVRRDLPAFESDEPEMINGAR